MSKLNTIRKLFRFFPIEQTLCLLSQNKNLDSFIGKMIPENHLYPSNTIRRVKRNGINYVLDISDYQNWLIYFGINSDRPEGLFELVKKRSVIIDVGSNIGQTAMTFAKVAGEDSMILGFEPDPVNYAQTIENLKQNNFKNVAYFNIGLGSEKKVLSLKINSPLNRGGNRIDQENKPDSIQIKIDRLDDILESKKISKVDLIKIDVEGFEFEVLKGASNTLKNYYPVLYIEVDDNNLKEQGSGAAEMVRHLSDLGYSLTIANTGKPINQALDLKNCHFDIICSKP